MAKRHKVKIDAFPFSAGTTVGVYEAKPEYVGVNPELPKGKPMRKTKVSDHQNIRVILQPGSYVMCGLIKRGKNRRKECVHFVVAGEGE